MSSRHRVSPLWTVVMPLGVVLRLVVALRTSKAFEKSFCPLLIAPQHDPELLAEGVLLFDAGQSPFAASSSIGSGARYPVNRLTLLLLLGIRANSRVWGSLSRTSSSDWVVWFVDHGGALWLQRLVAIAGDIGSTVLLYAIANTHVPSDELYQRARRIARCTWQEAEQRRRRGQRPQEGGDNDDKEDYGKDGTVEEEEEEGGGGEEDDKKKERVDEGKSKATVYDLAPVGRGVQIDGRSCLLSHANTPLIVSAAFMLHPFIIASTAFGSPEGVGHCALVGAIGAAMHATCSSVASIPASSSAFSYVYVVISAGCLSFAIFFDTCYISFLPLVLAILRNRQQRQHVYAKEGGGSGEGGGGDIHDNPSVPPWRRIFDFRGAVLLFYSANTMVASVMLAYASSLLVLPFINGGCNAALMAMRNLPRTATRALLPPILTTWLNSPLSVDDGVNYGIDGVGVVGMYDELTSAFYRTLHWIVPSCGHIGKLNSKLSLSRPTLGILWYLGVICFRHFRAYFEWLCIAQLHGYILPLITGLSSLPTADDPAAYSGVRARWNRQSTASVSKSTTLLKDATTSDWGSGRGGSISDNCSKVRSASCGALVAVSVLSLVGSIIHPLATMRTHATGLAMSCFRPCLCEEQFHGGDVNACRCRDSTHRTQGEINRLTSNLTSIHRGDSLQQSPPHTSAVFMIGIPVMSAGVAAMWWLWVCEQGRGNSNYFYFQCLGLHAFQTAYVCAYMTSAVHRVNVIITGEKRAQSQVCCAARRWLSRRCGRRSVFLSEAS
jgi:hypothetical protein